MRSAPAGLLLIGGLVAGCDAQVIDLRTAEALSPLDVGLGFRRDLGPMDAGQPVDAGNVDGGGEADAGEVADEVVLRRGTWTPRDYRASGSAEVVRLADGTVEVRFGDDFDVARVPGPVVVLSYRDRLGSEIEPALGDVELGVLINERGAQTYVVPGNLDDRDFVWVYCAPFGLEVGRAALVPVQ